MELLRSSWACLERPGPSHDNWPGLASAGESIQLSETGPWCRALPGVIKHILGVRSVARLLHVGAGAHAAVLPVIGDHRAWNMWDLQSPLSSLLAWPGLT